MRHFFILTDELEPVRLLHDEEIALKGKKMETNPT